MENWQSGLHKLIVLAHIGAEITKEFYLKYNYCGECKKCSGNHFSYCEDKFTSKDWVNIQEVTNLSYTWICPHWEPK